MPKNIPIKKLKEYFKKEPSVILAFLFGSFATGREMRETDLDIAVYLKDMKEKDEIWSEVSRITRKDVDLIILNEAPASLVSVVFRTGIPLAIKDKKLYWELFLEKSLEAEDFLGFVEDFRKIKEKTKSLPQEVKRSLSKRIDFLKDEIKKIDRFKKLSFKDYRDNWEERKIVERWAETIINALIDIAKIVMASEKKEMPRS